MAISDKPDRSTPNVPKPKLSRSAKVLAVLLIVFVFCDILLSPLGFETRGSAILGHMASLPWFGLLIVGLVLNLASLIILFFRRRPSSILAIVGSLIYVAVLLGDQAGFVVSIRPPPLITDVEIVTFFVLVAVIYFASRVYRESQPNMSPRR